MQPTIQSDPPGAGNMTILVADDDAHLRTAIRMRLSSWGYRVIESADGLGAIAKANGIRVDAILLDHEMPLGKGMAIVECLRRDTDAPIIFVSGHPCAEFRETLLRVPATYYLPKPLDHARLRELLVSLQPEMSCP
jgi:DNA-binding response OmpR family regulator